MMKVRVTDDYLDDQAERAGVSVDAYVASLPYEVEVLEAWRGTVESALAIGASADDVQSVIFIGEPVA